MSYYVGLDVSVKLVTGVCIIDDTARSRRNLWSPAIQIARCIAGVSGEIARVGLEAGPLAPWLFGGLVELGLPIICIEARQMKASAKALPLKTAGGTRG